MNQPLNKPVNLWLTGVLLTLIFVLSFYLQFDMLDRVKETVLASITDLSAKSLGLSLLPIVFQSFHLLDWVVIAVFVLLFAGVVFLQAWRKGISDFLSSVLTSDRRSVFFLLLLGLLFSKALLAPGAPYFMDAPSHVSRAWVSYLNFADGYAFPSWTNYYHNGFALFSHYGWLYYYLAGSLNLVVHQIELSCKLVTLILSLGNIVLFFVLGKALFTHRRTAFLLALIFACANFYLYEIFWVGALFYPLVVLGALVMFLSLEKFLSGRWNLVLAASMTALGAGVIIHTHLGFAAQVLIYFAPWALLRLILFYPGRWKSFIGYTLIAMAVGAVLSAFIFLPTWGDMGDVNFYKAFPFSDPSTYKFWQVPFWQFLVPRPVYTQYNYDYLGLVLVFMALAGLVLWLRKPDKQLFFFLGMAVVTLLVIGYYRNNILAFFTVAFFTAAAWNRQESWHQADHRLVAVVFIALLTDGLIFNNFNTFDNRKTNLDAAFQHLEKEADGTRLAAADANSLHTGNQLDNHVFMSPWLKVTGHRLVQPNAIMLEANKQALYQYAATSDLLISDVLSGTLNDTTLQTLNLLGVKYLLFHNSDTYYVPPVAPRSQVKPRADGPWLELDSTRSLVWAPAVTAWTDLPDSDQLTAQRQAFEKDDVSHNSAPFRYRESAGNLLKTLTQFQNPSLTAPRADRFVVRQGASEQLSPAGTPAQLAVNSFQVDSQTLKYQFSVDKPGFVALPFAWFRYQKVVLDGKAVESLPTAFNTVCVRVTQAGDHTLTVGPSLSPARTLGAWITGLGALLLGLAGLVGLILGRRKKITPGKTA